MLKNANFLAKIGADTAENEQHFAEKLPIGRQRGQPITAARLAQLLAVGVEEMNRVGPPARSARQFSIAA